MLWVLVTLALIGLAYLVAMKSFNYWADKGVKQGTLYEIFSELIFALFFRTKSAGELVQILYNAYPNNRYFGFYQFFAPTLALRDPDLIKHITVKGFDHFMDHRTITTEDAEPLWAKDLVSLKGQKWRDMRSTLSPAFTSSKMKQMFVLMSDSAEQFVRHFLKQKEDVVTVEMKDTFTRFTNDVIASTAFGVKCDSLEEKTNEFYLMGKEATDFVGFWTNLKMVGYLMFPKLGQLLGISLFSGAVGKFFTSLVADNIANRQRNGIVRPDMIHLLMEAKKNGLKYEEVQSAEESGFATAKESEVGRTANGKKAELTDVDITAQAVIFFFAGFDTVSKAMCFMSHELAVNPDIQERLRQEVEDTYAACNGRLTYDVLLGMNYMDMVVSETLRKWPGTVAMDRLCTKDYTIEPETPEEVPVRLVEGDLIWVPLYGLHHDPRYFPEPDRFDPERFSEENKTKITPYTYLPFGAGPRNCIGSRFALLEIKALFFHVLANFEIVPVEKTQVPLKLVKSFFNLTAEKGFWLGLKRRVK